MAENKPTNRERLREITDGIEDVYKRQAVSSSMTCWGNCTAMTTGLVITCYWMRKTA